MNQKSSIHKILLIDDEDDFSTTLASRLELRGFNVQCAQSGEHGISLLQKGHQDLILLDMRIGETSGIDVLNQIREIAPTVPVIIITGHSPEKCSIDLKELNIHDFIIKPLDFEDLTNSIKKLNG